MAEDTEKLMTCPCCGKLTLELPVKVKEAEMDHYTACLMTGQPYSKTYKLFKGKLQITVTALTDATRDKMNLLMSKFTLIEDDSIKDIANLFIVRLFAMLPVVSINKEKEGISLQATVSSMLDEALSKYNDKEWLEKNYKLLLDSKLTGGISKDIIDKVCAKHLQNAVMLRDSGFDPDFFTDIVQS